MSFGSYLKRQRESNKWTIKEVAERLGFSSSYVSQLENGTRFPSTKQLATLAKAYELPEEEVRKYWTEGKLHQVSMESNYKFDIKTVGEKRVHEMTSKLEQGLEELKKSISVDDRYIKMPVVNVIHAQNLEESLGVATEFFLFPKDKIPASHRMFGFRMDGLSLPDAGILAGDFIILDSDTKPKSGDIVVVATPDGLVMTYYHERGNYLELRPETEDFKKAYRLKESKVVGRLVYHIKKY